MHDRVFQIALTLVIAILLQLFVRSLIGIVIRRAVASHKQMSVAERKKRVTTLERVFQNSFSFILWIVVTVVVLAELQVNLAALLTGAGLLGVVIGIAAQSVVKNYLAGVFIILENQFQVGDVVSLGSIGSALTVSGVVEDITIRATKLRDMDGSLHIVTNGTATIITNMTYHYAAPVIDLMVGYDADIDLVENVINETGARMQDDDKFKDMIVEPIRFLRLDSFQPNAIDVKAVGKTRPGDQWAVAAEFRRRIKKAFDDNDIEMLLPQLAVNSSKH